MDPNYIPIMPLPLGNEVVGGEGKSLTLFQELELCAKEICNAMAVPLEFYMGGLSWSGSNMSLKLLENKFLSYRQKQLRLCEDFILGRIADYMDWNRPSISFKSFKMADDLQRAALIFQINQAQKISDESLLDALDFDLQKEQQKMRKELEIQLTTQRKMQKAQVNMQGEASLVQAKYQAMAQKKMMEAGMGGQTAPPQQGQQPGMEQPGQGQTQGEANAQQVPGMPEGASLYPENGQQQSPLPGAQSPIASPMQDQMGMEYIAREAANTLKDMDPISKQLGLMNMKGQNPDLFKSVLQLMNSEKGSQTSPIDPSVQMPQVKPPRR
jgi:hypothetical protein